MNARRALFALLLLLVIVLERASYYGHRSILAVVMTDFFGVDRLAGMQVYSWATTATGLAAILGGVIAIVVPRGALTLGGLVAAVAAMAAFSTGSLFGGLALVVLAAGLMKSTLYAWLAEPLAGSGSSVVIAAFFGAYAAINAGAFLAPLVTGALVRSSGAAAVFAVCGGLALFAAALAGVALAVQPEGEPPGPDEQAPGRALLLVALAWPALIAMGLVGERDFSALERLASADGAQWAFSVNPLVVILAGAALAVVAVVLARAGVRVPFGAAPVAGLVLYAASCSLSLASPAETAGEVAARMTLGALAEVLVLPSVMGALASASARLGALFLSVWIALSYLLGNLATWDVVRDGQTVLAASTAGLCLVCAGLLAWLTVVQRARDAAQPAAPPVG